MSFNYSEFGLPHSDAGSVDSLSLSSFGAGSAVPNAVPKTAFPYGPAAAGAIGLGSILNGVGSIINSATNTPSAKANAEFNLRKKTDNYAAGLGLPKGMSFINQLPHQLSSNGVDTMQTTWLTTGYKGTRLAELTGTQSY